MEDPIEFGEDEYGKTWNYDIHFAYLQPDEYNDWLLELDSWDGVWFTKTDLHNLIEMLQRINKEWPDGKMED